MDKSWPGLEIENLVFPKTRPDWTGTLLPSRTTSSPTHPSVPKVPRGPKDSEVPRVSMDYNGHPLDVRIPPYTCIHIL